MPHRYLIEFSGLQSGERKFQNNRATAIDISTTGLTSLPLGVNAAKGITPKTTRITTHNKPPKAYNSKRAGKTLTILKSRQRPPQQSLNLQAAATINTRGLL